MVTEDYLFILSTKLIVVFYFSHWNLSMEAEINDTAKTLITNSAAIFRFQYHTQTIWTWSQPPHIPSKATPNE